MPATGHVGSYSVEYDVLETTGEDPDNPGCLSGYYERYSGDFQVIARDTEVAPWDLYAIELSSENDDILAGDGSDPSSQMHVSIVMGQIQARAKLGCDSIRRLDFSPRRRMNCRR